MLDYKVPEFDFSAPLELAKRRSANETSNHPYRTAFMRDRDRVMYCSAFRRLTGKTQIYLAGKDDHQRNRLTHTLEVAQIARTIAWALGLNCDLTEAIALAHDLGHTPFGHAGEQILHEIMIPDSKITLKNSPMSDTALLSSEEIKSPLFGFKHNVQSVRVAATLENNYGDCGLNLTNFTLWGILHHSSTKYKEGCVNTNYLNPDYQEKYKSSWELIEGSNKEAWSFEAFVVSEADEIAQWHHDLEDALRGDAMTSSDVCGTILRTLNDILEEDDKTRLDELKRKKTIDSKYITDLSRIVVNTLVNRIIECSLYNLNLLWEKHKETGMDRKEFFIIHSWDEAEIRTAIKFNKFNETDKKLAKFEKEYPSIIKEKIHHSRNVERMNAKGQYIIKKLFQAYYTHPQQLPDGIILQYMLDVGEYKQYSSAVAVGMGGIRMKFEKFISNEQSYTLSARIHLMRKICDHIAGMTDHYAIEEYKNLYG